MDIFGHGIDRMCSSHPTCQSKLFIVNVGRDNSSSAKYGTYHRTKSYHSAADHHNSIDIADRSSCSGMETHTHRLHKGACTRIQPLCRDDLGPWKGHLLPHRSVSLHSESLVELACIRPTVPARRALSASCIWIYGHGHSRPYDVWHSLSDLLDHSADLMSRDHRKLHQRVAAQICIQIGSAESDIFETDDHLIRRRYRLVHMDKAHLPFTVYVYSFHLISLYSPSIRNKRRSRSI